MNGERDPGPLPTTAPTRRLWPWLVLPGAFFLLGLVAMGWTLTQWEGAARALGVAPEPVAQVPVRAPIVVQPAPQPRPPVPTQNAPKAPEQIVIDPDLARRVSTLEQRLGQVGTEARAAVGNADRAEGLLVAFAARRALDRGVALGFLEALLRQRFGENQPQAVGMIISAARNPVTLQELQDGLQQAGPQLVGAPPQQSWWGALRAELGSLITVRRQGTPSPEPAERLRRATRRLEAGQVDVALAEVLRMPGREHAQEWIEAARRYVGARRALDTIETAALLEPRTAPTPQPEGVQPQPQAATSNR
ncbi:MAG: hypothetical protein ACT4N8_14440 [Sphingosinicella sp.]|uniref:hypothetical protein n=1 Tax=Sphingosinicella sp. TaxID=1917971 RepID=UPI004037E650